MCLPQNVLLLYLISCLRFAKFSGYFHSFVLSTFNLCVFDTFSSVIRSVKLVIHMALDREHSTLWKETNHLTMWKRLKLTDDAERRMNGFFLFDVLLVRSLFLLRLLHYKRICWFYAINGLIRFTSFHSFSFSLSLALVQILLRRIKCTCFQMAPTPTMTHHKHTCLLA